MSLLVKLLVLGTLTGIVAIILGAVLGFKVLPESIDENVKNKMRLEMAESYSNWKTLPYTVTTNFYFFNITNAPEVMDGADPVLQEIGPLAYSQTRSKENIAYNARKDLFTYDQRVKHKYDIQSNVSIDAEIVTLNLFKYLSVQLVNDNDIFTTVMYSFANIFPDIENNELFHKISLETLLTKGYEVGGRSKGQLTMEERILRAKIIARFDNNVRFQKNPANDAYLFSLFKHKLNYIESTYEMYGGKFDIKKQGRINRSNGSSVLDVWPKFDHVNYCNQIRGTDSFTFPPAIDVDDGLVIYYPDLCRSLDFAFTGNVVVNDIAGERLVLKSENFAPAPAVPENSCFCMEENGNCLPTGFLDLSTCLGMPLIASQPHFLFTEPEYYEILKLTPNEDKHISFIEIQAETGVLLRATKRTQYNIMLKNIPGFADNIKPVMLPLYWIEEVMEIPEESIKTLNSGYLSDLVMIEAVKWCLLAVGAAFVLGCAVTFMLTKLKLGNKS